MEKFVVFLNKILVIKMVFPGVVRRAMKMMPTVIQALALVVFIHVIGQVSNKLIVIYLISNKISVIL